MSLDRCMDKQNVVYTMEYHDKMTVARGWGKGNGELLHRYKVIKTTTKKPHITIYTYYCDQTK